jgi:hypothetical protein
VLPVQQTQQQQFQAMPPQYTQSLADKPSPMQYNVQPVGYQQRGQQEVHMLDGRPGVAQLP